MKRGIIIVLDSLGIGALPDAHLYKDEGSNTLGNIMKENPDLNLRNLSRLGLGNIEGVKIPSLKEDNPVGSYGRMKEASKGKDTTTGHWEIAGLLTTEPFKTYPEGFPQEFIKAFEERIGTKVLGNYAESGTVIIEDLGPLHEKTAQPIVYTSADSVFQIAANVDVIPLEKLYELCEIAREMLVGDWACGRVIARPYKIIDGKRVRTSDRKDYSVSPPSATLLDKVKDRGQTVYAVGKINDIFNGKGVTESVHTDSNMDGVDKTLDALREDFEGLLFVNLVDFDAKYGHRRDAQGYGRALKDFDERLPEIYETLKEDDILFICADHGNDPDHEGFDHTREYIPLLVYGAKVKPGINLGTGETFANIGATIASYLETEDLDLGKSFLDKII